MGPGNLNDQRATRKNEATPRGNPFNVASFNIYTYSNYNDLILFKLLVMPNNSIDFLLYAMAASSGVS